MTKNCERKDKDVLFGKGSVGSSTKTKEFLDGGTGLCRAGNRSSSLGGIATIASSDTIAMLYSTVI